MRRAVTRTKIMSHFRSLGSIASLFNLLGSERP